ncbi:MAG TPA: type IV secretion system protein [Steroidobacteraceae bacterium]|jgi:type IV secretion system protein VirB8
MKDAALEAYFAEAASWDADRASQSRRETRIAWTVAGAGWVATLATAAALMLLMPLKRVEPFVVRVDNSTGLVDVVPVYAGYADMPEAVTRFFLDHYVTVCERFNFATAESDYEECGAYHTAARNQAWYTLWTKTNPGSPLNVYKDGTTVRAQVSSISFFGRSSGVSDLAQVRYTKAKRPAGGTDEQVTHWIASVQYTYGEPSKDPKVRRWNPLGFKVVEFKSEPEVLNEPVGAMASDPGPGGRSP